MSGITPYWRCWLALGKLLLVGGAIIASGNCAKAQSITLDGTLGPAQTLTGPDYVIPQTVGQTVGNNLFHSFGQFNLNTNEAAIFESAANIQNILSRVTGSTPSLIDGLIRTSSGSVNLFLINPQGIIFGPNAQLNIGGSTRGSFIATTLDAIVFPNGGQFSATNPRGADSLLRIVGDPSGFLASQRPAAPIASSGSILSVYEGQSLALLGGEVELDDSILYAQGGQVELGGVSGEGSVELLADGNKLRLGFPDGIKRNDVSIANGSRISVMGKDGGSIAINAQNLDISEGRLGAGIESEQGTASSQAGDITLNATEAIRVRQSSRIGNLVNPNATGNGGNLIFTTGSLSVTDGSQLLALTGGQGNGGNVIIDARDRVSLDGNNSYIFSSVAGTGRGQAGDIRITTGSLLLSNGAALIGGTLGWGNSGNVIIDARDRVSLDGNNSYIFSSVEKTGRGQGGDISITTDSLSLTDAQLQAGVLTGGVGDSGSIIINARDGISLNGNNSYVSTNVSENATGRGGDIRMKTGYLLVNNGTQILANTNGQGDAGNVIIDARDRVWFDGSSSDGNFATAASSNVEKRGIGKGGDISITAASLALTNGAQLFATTDGQGDAGNIIIDARDRVFFDGRSTNGSFGSDAFSDVGLTGIGNGGDIRITTGLLSVTNGAQLLAITRGQGNAGNIIINARNTISLQGVGNKGFSSLISTGSVSDAGVGGEIIATTADFQVADGALVDARTVSSKPGGNVTINADNFEATNGGQVITSTTSSGQAGNISLNVTNSATLSGSDRTYTDRLTRFGDSQVGGSILNLGAESGLFASTSSGSQGKGGDISVNTRTLNVRDTAKIAVNSQGTGEGGNIDIKADNITLKNQAIISAETLSSQGGNINLGLKDILLLRQGSQISTNAGTAQQGGNGGNITINAPSGFIAAASNENSDITANAFSGSGGQVTINTTNIFGIAPLTRQELERLRPNDLDPRQLITSDITAISQTSPNLSGTITINTLNIEPNRGLVNLPAAPLDNQVSQVCQPRSAQNQSSFIITGRGGLPPNPRTEPLSSDAVEVDWVTLKPMDENRANTNVSTQTISPTPAPIVEAQGWMRNVKGEVVLTADASTATPRNSWQIPTQCSSINN
ncbi:hypothetical protein NSTC745_04374 [Nostoc sp. DSM 114161]|jgi:filamentous hemagglutinin family protein|uniref:two-partner secretion domain-containing protein n=1 Tax=Nostoc sp. DSM 114161 TaxID=3440143 RepID=UPI004045844A